MLQEAGERQQHSCSAASKAVHCRGNSGHSRCLEATLSKAHGSAQTGATGANNYRIEGVVDNLIRTSCLLGIGRKSCGAARAGRSPAQQLQGATHRSRASRQLLVALV